MDKVDSFTSSIQCLLAELERIDLLIRLQVHRARQLHAADAQFEGLYISEEEVDTLMAQQAGLPRWATDDAALSLADMTALLDSMATRVEQRRAAGRAQGVICRLDVLAQLFDLTAFDRDVLLICLAPEIDRRYELLYAYLQDDVTRRRPSVDLVLNLLSPSLEAKLSMRQQLASQSSLLSHELVVLFDDPAESHPTLLRKHLKADERIVNYLFGADDLDARLLPYARLGSPKNHLADLLLPAEVKDRLQWLVQNPESPNPSMVLYLQGPYGVGKQTTASALSNELGVRLLIVDGEKALNNDLLAFETCVHLAAREALLQGAMLFWDSFDALLTDDRRAWRNVLLHTLERQPGITVLSGDTTWEPADALETLPFVRVEIGRPGYADRRQFWSRSLNGNALTVSEDELGALATKFRFTAGQIRDAAATARNLAHWRDPQNEAVTLAELHTASRLHSNRNLAALARKITPHYTWDDIVLPGDRMRQLREIVIQIKFRAKVYDEWGFDHKLAMGKGLNALFAGPSGTGKTMAADIMAGELGLDLYKIDLSNVVSKYIGETEKNLARIFQEAETSNSILFFDEADALFGKRSEVRDSHDRYANIEISYLLQRMEEYEGMVILATNLSKNLDDAFVRRMHFALEFPFPDVKHRRRIWEKIWPAELPRSLDLNLDFVAERIELAGGNIRNVALAAASFAASDGEVVTMAHLMRAVQREFQKMGKVIMPKEFGEYAHLVS